MTCASHKRRKCRFSRTRRAYALNEPMSGLGEKTHLTLDQLHGGVGDRRDALGALAQHARHVPRVGDNLSIALLEGLELRHHHLRYLFLQIAVPHAREVRLHLTIIPTAERLGDAEKIADAAFTWYCVIRASHPTGVTQVSIQASSACAGTADCTITLDCLGSMPAARYNAAISTIFERSSFGSWCTVIACRSTMQKIHS